MMAAGTGESSVKRPAVLVVDDDKDVRTFVCSLIESEGAFDVYEADNGDRALDIVTEERPQLVILDYMMPGMTGEDVAKRIRTVAPGARIIAFSAVLQRAPAWADAHLEKSDVANLIPMIQREAQAAPR